MQCNAMKFQTPCASPGSSLEIQTLGPLQVRICILTSSPATRVRGRVGVELSFCNFNAQTKSPGSSLSGGLGASKSHVRAGHQGGSVFECRFPAGATRASACDPRAPGWLVRAWRRGTGRGSEGLAQGQSAFRPLDKATAWSRHAVSQSRRRAWAGRSWVPSPGARALRVSLGIPNPRSSRHVMSRRKQARPQHLDSRQLQPERPEVAAELGEFWGLQFAVT